MQRILLIAAVACLLGIGTARTNARVQPRWHNRPPVVLWAWERPEDLAYVDPRTTGIAFLAGTVLINEDGAIVVPRRQPLRVPDRSSLVAVVRIEPDRRAHGRLSPAVLPDVAGAITELAGSFKAASLQIDFDASASERILYRELLEELRQRLPSGVSLTMTALASWCVHDTWMDDLPVDEAVPMLFRMGPEGPDIMRTIEEQGDLREPLCRSSVGIATDELKGRILPGKRIYVFSPEPWTEDQANAVIAEVIRWQ